MFGPSLKKIEKWAEKGKIASLEKVIMGNNVEFRDAAFAALGKSKDHEAINLLTNFVRHPDAEFRRLAAHAMGDTGAERTLEFLKKLSRDDDNEDVRKTAMDAILKINKVLAQEE